MLARLISFILMAAVTFPSLAEQTKPAPLLWQINGAPTHYLFGTIHLPDPRVTNLSPVVKQALQQSGLVVTELEFSASNLMAMTSAGMLPVGESLSEKLTPALRRELQTELTAIEPQFRVAMFDRMKIWALATNLALLPIQRQYPGVAPLDLQLVQEARQRGVKNIGLEQLDEQIRIFDSLSTDDQLSLLADAIQLRKQARTTGPDYLELMIKAYTDGNADQIIRLTEEGLSNNPQLGERLRKQLIDERNTRMAERIEALIKAQGNRSVFFAVGAAHLVGKGSVIEQLRERGYNISRAGEAQDDNDERTAVANR